MDFEQQQLEVIEEKVRAHAKSSSHHLRPSIVIDNPSYSFDETTTARRGQDNPYNTDLSNYDDDSDSGSGESFASETSDGILSPEEIAKQEKQIIALKEHQRVFRARIFVVILLLMTAISNALIVYFLTHNQEMDDYARHVSVFIRGLLCWRLCQLGIFTHCYTLLTLP